jgi:hypothetical protein
MHLSKHVLYVAIIAYSIALLLLQDWGMMASTTGLYQSGPWLLKMVVDVAFCAMALIRLAGPAFFASEDDDDDEAVTVEDLQFSDTALFGCFCLNLVCNGAFHGYEALYTQGAGSVYFSIWFIVELFGVFVTGMLWKHAITAQRRKARKARLDRDPRPVSSIRDRGAA